MSDAETGLVANKSHHVPSRVESLTNQFYAWEQRGRGWLLYPYPVPLEPPFQPFYHFHIPTKPIDDGRTHTFWSRLIENFMNGSKTKQEIVEEVDLENVYSLQDFEPEYYVPDDEIIEIQIILKPDEKIDQKTAQQFMMSMTFSSFPISFEIIGVDKGVIVQLSCRESDKFIIVEQINAHFPDTIINEKSEYLENHWYNIEDEEFVIVDFGLKHEFVQPIRTFSSFDHDPLITIIGGMSGIQEDEIGILQVLFQPVHFPWAESIFRSVTDWQGKAFFVDAQEMVSLAKQKISHPLYAVMIRIAAKTKYTPRSWQIVRSIGNGLSQFNNPTSNELIPLEDEDYSVLDHEYDLLNRVSRRSGMILNAEELISFVHFPSSSVKSQRLNRIDIETNPVPHICIDNPCVLGENEHNGEINDVTLSDTQRLQHMHVIGASGTGKSTFLLNLIIQDIEQGKGIAVLDPHGDLIDNILEYIPEERHEKVILLDPADEEYPIGFNIMTAHNEAEKTVLSSDLVATFQKHATSWGDQMTTVLANAILAFLESDRGGTLAELRLFLSDSKFRDQYLESLEDRELLHFWQNEFTKLRSNSISSLLSRLNTFLRSKLIRHIVGQKESKLNFNTIMNDGYIFLAKLSQGIIGEENAHLLGTLLVSKFQQTAMSRQNMSVVSRKPYYLYIDECHNFVCSSMTTILSSTRKYGLGLILAHQDVEQLMGSDRKIASSVFANAYTRICFRVSTSDAGKLSEGLSHFDKSVLQNLGTGEAIVRVERSTFDCNLTVPYPDEIPLEIAENRRNCILELSRESFARPKLEVETELESLIPSTPIEKGTKKTVKPKELDTAFGEDDIEEVIDNDVEVAENETIEKPVIQEKFLAPQTETKNPPRIIKPKDDPLMMGKGGQQHRYIQQLIKRWSEGMGYKATIEKPIQNGAGQVDIVLEKDNRSIACEISVTTPPSHEVENIKKCLNESFDYIMVISNDTKKLRLIKNEATKLLSSIQLEKVCFFNTEDLIAFVETLEAESSSTSETVKGYKVNVNYKVVSEENKEIKKNAVSNVIAQALKKMKGK